jgi:hypothetical protein
LGWDVYILRQCQRRYHALPLSPFRTERVKAYRNKLGRQFFAALGAARSQNQTATFGCHTRTKTVTAGTNKVRGLKSALHRDLHQTFALIWIDSKAVNLKPVL